MTKLKILLTESYCGLSLFTQVLYNKKMKMLLLLVIFFLFGLAISLSFLYWNRQVTDSQSVNSAITTKFSLENAPSNSLRGTIATMSGTISWLSRTGSKPIKLIKPRTIQQGEALGTGADGKAVVTIQNDAALELSPNAHLALIQLLPQNFVFLQDKGSILYENSIKVPISVRNYDLLTVMTKGVMTVLVDATKKTVTVAVEKGTVQEGFEDTQNNSTVISVATGQTFVFDETTKTGSVISNLPHAH